MTSLPERQDAIPPHHGMYLASTWLESPTAPACLSGKPRPGQRRSSGSGCWGNNEHCPKGSGCKRCHEKPGTGGRGRGDLGISSDNYAEVVQDFDLINGNYNKRIAACSGTTWSRMHDNSVSEGGWRASSTRRKNAQSSRARREFMAVWRWAFRSGKVTEPWRCRTK